MFDLKVRFQRFCRGYSYGDCYNLKYWFSETLPKMIKELRDRGMGYPAANKFEEVDNFPVEWIKEVSNKIIKSKVKNNLDEELNLQDGFDRWHLILTRISWCLEETERDIENEYWDEYFYKQYEDKKYRDKWLKRQLEIDDYKDKCKDEAFDLLKKYFWNLWD